MPLRPFVALIVALAGAASQPTVAFAGGASAAAAPTAPPEIIHLVTTPMCVRMHDLVRPAVGMILENDTSIAKSPPLFKDYGRNAFSGDPNGMTGTSGNMTPQQDSINVDNPGTKMALQKMSYLVHPIAENLISSQTLLDNPELTKPTGNPADDAKLAKIRQQLLQAVAMQSASLDVINGFVTTQQMGELQHAGEEYISAITSSDSTVTIPQASPFPGTQDPNAPGIAQNPYSIDLSTIPGLSVGYNPLSNITSGLDWLRSETAKRESDAAKSVTAAIDECNALTPSPPSPHPPPH